MEKKRHVLRAEGSFICHKDAATHPRAMKYIIEQIEGIEIIDNALPNLWLIAATDEALEELKDKIQGWSVKPEVAHSSLPQQPTPLIPPGGPQ